MTAAAKTNYDNGVTAAFDRWFGAASNVADFIGAGKAYEFNQTSATTMLQSIWRQKWVAAVRCQAWEAFCDVNRTGYPQVVAGTTQDPTYVVGNFSPSINTVLGGVIVPRRLIYPKTSSDYNKNTPVALPMQTKLWWHK